MEIRVIQARHTYLIKCKSVLAQAANIKLVNQTLPTLKHFQYTYVGVLYVRGIRALAGIPVTVPINGSTGTA